MRFTKMHGAGNDYIYIDCFHESTPKDPAELAKKLSDRHFGIGGDGLVLISPPVAAQNDARMRMFNADGSEAEMCGNAIRCVAKYLYDYRIVEKKQMTIESGRGPMTLDLDIKNGKMTLARVNMLAPILESAKIPTTLPGDPPINAPIEVDGKRIEVTCVSMGNPHAVIFLDEDPTDEWVLGLGPKIEKLPIFPRRTNVEFVHVLSNNEIRMRVWERGSGETYACGTGACGVCVAGVLTGRTGRKITAHLLGGDLELEWAADDQPVFMTGAAKEVFTGEMSI